MKKLMLLLVAILGISSSLIAQNQKIAYVYSEKVFKAMPEYNNAVKQLEALSEAAKKMAEMKLEEVKTMYNDYKKIESSLSESSRKQQRDYIVQKEREANNYLENFYAEGGEMTKKQKELMEPIEKKVTDATAAVAEKNGYDFIFDFSVVQIALFKSEKYNVTQEVLSIVLGN